MKTFNQLKKGDVVYQYEPKVNGFEVTRWVVERVKKEQLLELAIKQNRLLRDSVCKFVYIPHDKENKSTSPMQFFKGCDPTDFDIGYISTVNVEDDF